MTNVDIYLYPVEKLSEFTDFCTWALAAANPPNPNSESNSTSTNQNANSKIDSNPNKSQDRCNPEQVYRLFFCCWNRIQTFDLSIVAARAIPYFYRKDSQIGNLLTEVAEERLQYRRTHFGRDFREDTVRGVVEGKVRDIEGFGERRRRRRMYGRELGCIILEYADLDGETERALRNQVEQ